VTIGLGYTVTSGHTVRKAENGRQTQKKPSRPNGNSADEPRVALAVRYAPWWLNLEVLRPESNERKQMCDESGKTENVVPSIHPDVYDHLPTNVQPLFRHWVG
jgi:hypothetical protein